MSELTKLSIMNNTSTQGIFSIFERDELNKITAKSILEKLMNIRQKIDVNFTARRLIWELMQNAKDNVAICSGQKEKVDIAISLNEKEFVFSHNKGFFTNEHIRGLIRKYSSSDKDRETIQPGSSYKTTGRFGTGFMTTHLLSEKVIIEGFYKNESSNYNKFSFGLDRSGKSESKIIEGINTSFEEAENSIKESPSSTLEKNEFRTSFIYPLSETRFSLANIAISEVYEGVAYTLINVPEINSVTINEELIGELTYQVQLVESKQFKQHIFKVYNLLLNGKNSQHYFLTANNESVQIIIPISRKGNKYYVVELNSSVPRLHLDFPMIGTEDLNLPFIVNSSLFEPTEPRDGVSLIEDEENEITSLNCNLIAQAVTLYNNFLSYVGTDHSWNDLYNLARIKPPKKHTWIDSDWFRKNVVTLIREKLLHTPIVDVANGGRIAIWDENDECQIYFPFAENAFIREKIWKLIKQIHPGHVPIKEHIDKWSEVIWNDCYKFTLEELSKEISDKENMIYLSECFEDESSDAITFLNDYYALLNNEGSHITDIVADKYAVIPNQLGEFKKKSILSIDEGIDEEIKNVCSIISENPRDILLHKQAYTGDGILYSIKNQLDIINEVNKVLKENTHENVSIACDYLVSLFPKDKVDKKRLAIFNFSKKIFPDNFKIKREIKKYDEHIWEESDKKSIYFIVSAIAEKKTVDCVCDELDFESPEKFLGWLDELVTFLVNEGFQNNISREKHPILPNQNGLFCTKDNLFLDDGTIPEELKDISSELGYDFRVELLDKSIFLELPDNRIYTIADVAEKITTLVKPLLRDIDSRKSKSTTLKKIYLWMNDNREEAEKYLSDIFEKRFLFLEDDDISLNMKKASEFDQLMEEHGIKDIEDLRAQLSKLIGEKIGGVDENERIDITKEILVSLGISSPQELIEAFKDPEISSRFYHTSTPTTDMFIYAQILIDRAKKNIIHHLESHPDYDCSDLEETAPTILAGILKNGVPIQIVTRPSDNGEVIIYYSSEKDTLDSDNSELWVDNGTISPHILTLGRILKSTGINRIPINMK